VLKQFHIVFNLIYSKLCNCLCLKCNKRDSRHQNVITWQRNHNVSMYNDFNYGIASVLTLHCIEFVS